MEMIEALTRINELAAKKKSGHALTPAELAEKKELYKIYLGYIRAQVVQQLDSIEFVDDVEAEKAKRAAAKKAEISVDSEGHMHESDGVMEVEELDIDLSGKEADGPKGSLRGNHENHQSH